jgi:hypothetical protein
MRGHEPGFDVVARSDGVIDDRTAERSAVVLVDTGRPSALDAVPDFDLFSPIHLAAQL